MEHQGVGLQNEAFYDLLQPTAAGVQSSGVHTTTNYVQNGSNRRNESFTSEYVFGKDDILPNYDFQPSGGSRAEENSSQMRHPSPARTYNSYDSSVYHSRDQSQIAYEHQSRRQEHDKESYDTATIAAVERTMKKYADNLLRVLEGMTGRLSQLETATQRIETSVEKLKGVVADNHGESDGKARMLENMIREVQRGVQILRDKQEISEAQSQLLNLQKPKMESQDASGSNLPSQETPSQVLQQQPPPQSQPQPPPSSPPQQLMQPQLEQSSLVHTHSVPLQQSHFPQQPQPTLHGVQQPAQPQQQTPLPPPPQQLQQQPQPQPQPQPQLVQQPQPPQPPLQQPPSHSMQMQMPPYYPSQQQTPHSSQGPPMQQYMHDGVAYGSHTQNPHQPAQNPPPPVNYPSEMPPYMSTGYGAPSSRPLAMPPHGSHGHPSYDSPRPGQLALPAPPFGHQGQSLPPPMYDMQATSSGGYGGSGYRVPPSVPSAPSSGGYPHLPTAQPVQQSLPHAGSRNPVDEIVEKVATMGFPRDQVRGAVRRLNDSGQTVDLNSVLDKLMNGGGDGQPPKGWFVR